MSFTIMLQYFVFHITMVIGAKLIHTTINNPHSMLRLVYEELRTNKTKATKQTNKNNNRCTKIKCTFPAARVRCIWHPFLPPCFFTVVTNTNKTLKWKNWKNICNTELFENKETKVSADAFHKIYS